jgi:ABC-2 type transport system permease protein
MFPFSGMPIWAQWLGEIFPLTHFLRIVRAVMLKGAGLSSIITEVAWLFGFVLLFAGFALLRFRRTLD